MLTSLRNLARHRALVWALVQRALRARYRGSFLGFVWSFLNPLLLLLVYTLVFRYVFAPRHGSGPEPYALFLFTGLLPWIWLSSSLMEASQSIADGGALLKKIAFPAEVLPLVAVLANAVHFLLAAPVLLVFLAVWGPGLSPQALLAPLPMLVEFLYATGLGLGLAALGVRYRDVRDLLANFLTLWFFASPVFYAIESLPENIRRYVVLNPLGPILDAYHNTLFYGRAPAWIPLGVSALVGLALTLAGYALFERFRESFAEEV